MIGARELQAVADEMRAARDGVRQVAPISARLAGFDLAAAPRPGGGLAALLDCIDWFALGFELVPSPFPGWRCASSPESALQKIRANAAAGAAE